MTVPTDLPETMLAERFHTASREVKLEQVPVPLPGPGEVLIKVAFCGICHSDLSLMNGNLKAHADVLTQGHEVSGTIVAVGEGVDRWSIGDRVVPGVGRPCGRCNNCMVGDPAHCLDMDLMSFAYDGGWAEYVKVPAVGCTLIPDNVPFEQAALLADAVATPFGAVVHTAQVRLGETVGIWGVGGVGTHLVQIAKLAGAAPVIAMDLNEAALQRAKRVGADYAFRSDDPQLLENIREATGGRMLNVAFDAVGLTGVTKQAIQALAVTGRAVNVGMSAQQIEAGTFRDFVVGRHQVRGSLGYEVQDIGLLAGLLSYGRLDLSESVSAIVPLAEVQRGIEMLEKKEGNPIRILVQP